MWFKVAVLCCVLSEIGINVLLLIYIAWSQNGYLPAGLTGVRVCGAHHNHGGADSSCLPQAQAVVLLLSEHRRLVISIVHVYDHLRGMRKRCNIKGLILKSQVVQLSSFSPWRSSSCCPHRCCRLPLPARVNCWFLCQEVWGLSTPTRSVCLCWTDCYCYLHTHTSTHKEMIWKRDWSHHTAHLECFNAWAWNIEMFLFPFKQLSQMYLRI